MEETIGGIVVLLLAIAASCLPQPSSSALSCEQTDRPEEYYRNEMRTVHVALTERTANLVAQAGIHGQRLLEASHNPRGVQVSPVLDVYSDSSLVCWARDGDQLAALALFQRHEKLGDANAATGWLLVAARGNDVLNEIDAEGISINNACSAEMAEGNAHCRFGLPEAQFELGLRYRKDPQTVNQGLDVFERAYRSGLWPARAEAMQRCRL